MREKYYPILINKLTEKELMVCPFESFFGNSEGGHRWVNREWIPEKCEWHDYCEKCGIERFFNTRGYVMLKKGDLIYEYKSEFK